MVKAPRDPAAQIEFVGPQLFGKNWCSRLAIALDISRSTLRLWRLGISNTDADISSELVTLIERERAANTSRGVELTALRHAIVRASRRTSDAAA